jgi:hypothetical protein
MERRLIFISVLFLCTYFTQAQEDTTSLQRGTIYPGYIIQREGDTVHGYLLNTNLWYNQVMVFYYTDSSDRENRIKYKAKDIKGYMVGNRMYDSYKHPANYSTHAFNFFLRKITGPVNYYLWYYDPDKGNLIEPVLTLEGLASALLFSEDELWTQEVVKKGEDDPVDLNIIGFAKTMSGIIKDDPELARKVKDKESGYKSIDAAKIVQEYNDRRMNPE